MGRPMDVCKLCLQTALLEDSHFMPASLYNYCRGAAGEDPILVTPQFAMSTSRQTSDYVFCSGCEDVFDERGEKWLTPKLARYRGEFPLYDLVTAGPLVLSESDYAVHGASQNGRVDVPKIIHFALGLFYKAAVHAWSGTSSEPRLDLGPYREEIRRYLRGGALPNNAALNVVLARPGSGSIGFNFPHVGYRESTYRTYVVFVPGVQFMLALGKIIPPELTACSITEPDSPIFISDSIAAQSENKVKWALNMARKTKSFRGAMDKVRAERVKASSGQS